MTSFVQAEIYRWVDEFGQVHYSETNSENNSAEEITDQLLEVGNFFEFSDVIDIEWYKPPPGYRKAKVEIQIDLIQYQLSDSERAYIQSHISGIYEAYARWFGWPRLPTRPIKVKIFGNFTVFEQYQKEQYNGYATTRSHYAHRSREVVMLGTEFKHATLGVLYHEASHAIMHMQFNTTPKWINEGLAECFELVNVASDKIVLRHNPLWVEKIQHKLREGSLQSLAQYLKISNQEWGMSHSRVEGTYYMIAWSLMSTLLSSQRGIDTLRQVFYNLNSSGWWQPEGLSQLFDDHYPGGLDKLERDWRFWISKL